MIWRIKFIVILLILSSISFGQSKTEENNYTNEREKDINEISYQFPLGFGYSHIFNLNSKFLLGTGIHVGLVQYLPRYSDFVLFKFYSRNLFNRQKLNKKLDYDIGIFTSLSYQYEALLYGLLLSGYDNIKKFKIGANILISVMNKSSDVLYPIPSFNLILIYTF